jgi:alkyldihydroxyacetonephosphate synthase
MLSYNMRTEPIWLDDLREVLAGDEISSARADLLAHAYDASAAASKWRQQGTERWLPDVVAKPRTIEALSDLLQWASSTGIAVTPWGAGSAVTGAPLAAGGIALDMTAMNRVLEINSNDLVARVEGGILGSALEATLNEQGLTLNQSPQSLHRSTVGGWLATRASGHFSSRWGGVEAHVLATTVVLSDGTIIRTPLTTRVAIGPDLSQLFVGSEGTLGVIAEVALRVYTASASRLYETVVFRDVASGLAAVQSVARAGLQPFLVRLYDADETRHLPGSESADECALLLGCEGVRDVAAAELAATVDLCVAGGGDPRGETAAKAWMERRFDFRAVEEVLERNGGVAETIEVSDFWTNILDTYQALKAALKPLCDEVLGHFSHIYPQGTSLYLIILGQVEDDAKAESRIQEIWDTAMQVCLDRGASLAHHHGVGLVRLAYVEPSLGSASLLLDRLKTSLDPTGTLCPGKLGLSGESERSLSVRPS